jgi:hypothetical protein
MNHVSCSVCASVCYIYVSSGNHGYARFGTASAGGIIPMNRVIQGLPRTCTIWWCSDRASEVEKEWMRRSAGT